ncbi:hypothetical protein H9P43_009109 [Blastocladiella emersonii ATCC 22665]|nr:hypothetical protein H9P43_009109 [Blastocladiella emersonii ATCC 22665]
MSPRAALLLALLALAFTETHAIARTLPAAACIPRADAAKFGHVQVLETDEDVVRRVYPPVVLEYGAWASANVTTHLAAFLARDILGLSVSLSERDSAAGVYPRLASGTTTASLEVWPANKAALYRAYVTEARAVRDLGPTGYAGSVSWYLPGSLENQRPEILVDSWRSLALPDLLALLPPAGTTPPARLLTGEYVCGAPVCTDGVYVPPQCRFGGICRELWHIRPGLNPGETEQRIHDLGLPLVVVYLGDTFDARVTACLAAADPARTCLFYAWAPYPALAAFALQRVHLPGYTPGCWSRFNATLAGSGETRLECDWPVEVLQKLAHPGTMEEVPQVAGLLRGFSVADDALRGMLARLDAGEEVADVACDWIRAHETTWSAWIGVPPADHVVPIRRASWLDADLLLLLLLTSLTTLLILLTLAATYRLRTEPALRVQSPSLVALHLAGSLLLILGLFLPTLSLAACPARAFLTSLGLAAIQFATAARVWRVHAIVANVSFSVVVFGRLATVRGTTIRQIMAAFAVCAAGVAVAVAPWTAAVAGSSADLVPLATLPPSFARVCPRPETAAWIALVPVVLVHVPLAAATAWLVRKTRNVVTLTADPRAAARVYEYLGVGIGVGVGILLGAPRMPMVHLWTVPVVAAVAGLVVHSAAVPVALVAMAAAVGKGARGGGGGGGAQSSVSDDRSGTATATATATATRGESATSHTPTTTAAAAATDSAADPTRRASWWRRLSATHLSPASALARRKSSILTTAGASHRRDAEAAVPDPGVITMLIDADDAASLWAVGEDEDGGSDEDVVPAGPAAKDVAAAAAYRPKSSRLIASAAFTDHDPASSPAGASFTPPDAVADLGIGLPSPPSPALLLRATSGTATATVSRKPPRSAALIALLPAHVPRAFVSVRRAWGSWTPGFICVVPRA